ncbi:cyclic AMP-dependent transcription factor ATF-4-like [Pristis pectinata]|uniref:cyclic AMP-dependent transcription factor ATF-4-like n=1 Tax=Pristis pectinata TaxID=685728 RepID=UPI00223D7973|nr:cyclic AMP-dependent transcription factor ATF-4-like [Pristis pectinata]
MSVWSDSPFSSLMEDCMSYLDSPFLMADGDPCLLHVDSEAGPVKSCLRPHQFGGNEESEVSSQCPCIDPLDTNNVEDAFTGLDWMVEKVDFFDTLNEDENGCHSPEDLLAVLNSCDLLEELPFEPLPAKQVVDLGLSLDLGSFPNSPKGLDQLAPGTPTVVPESIFFPDNSFHLEVEKVIDSSDVEEKPDVALFQSSTLQDSCKEMDEGPILDSDSGLGSSPPHSPVESLDRSVSERSPEARSLLNDFSPVRSKPYDRPGTETVGSSPKVKGNCMEPKSMEKKLKKMEQNKSAATRYRQKKRAEQGAIVAECSLLEEKNKTLQEKADSLTKEIQYLKGLIEEVRKAKSKSIKSL